MDKREFKALLKRVVELVMPDLRSYYRVERKARVVKTYAAGEKYYADVQPLNNDESVDEKEPVVEKVEIPVMWAGPNRGVICPPEEGVYCVLTYSNGDPDYPRISDFRWHDMGAPACAIGEFIIQQGDGVFINIDAGGNIKAKTPGIITLDRGDQTITIDDNVKVAAAGNIELNRGAQKIILDDAGVSIDGGSGDMDGVITGKCVCHLTGGPIADKSSDVKASK